MASPAPDVNAPGAAQFEEWFLAQLENESTAFDTLVDTLVRFRQMNCFDKADACAELLTEALIQRRRAEDLLKLLEIRAAWHAADWSFAAVCAGALASFFKGDSLAGVHLLSAGFENGLPAAECLRRFRVLRALRPGALCYEKTWGFGIVAEIDAYSRQVVIDFEKKKSHRMACAYAAATLKMLADDHILARKHRQPQAFAQWVADDPAGVVKAILRDFGPLNVIRLQEFSVGRILPAEAWKRFWEAARKKLKQDPLVEFPAGKSDPLRLLDKVKAFDGQWRDAFGQERDFERILAQIDELQANKAPAKPAVEFLDVIEDRLAFIIQGADKDAWELRVAALIAGAALGVKWRNPQCDSLLDEFYRPAVLLDALRGLPARQVQPLLKLIHTRDAERTAAVISRILDELPLTPFCEAIDFLRETGNDTTFIEKLKAGFAGSKATCEMICWVSRNLDFAVQHGICAPEQLAAAALGALESSAATGDRLKARNLLRSLFEQADWLKTAVGALSAQQRVDFIRRLKKSQVWAALDRNVVLVRIIQAFPELGEALTDKTAVASAVVPRLSSLRSCHARQLQLDKLIEEDIPKNSRDIGVARSYGDLSENYEYKAAREMQGILMRRRGELEKDLHEVKGTDFAGFPCSRAGMGTTVGLRLPDGRAARYHILGEWDSHEPLGIISSQSRLAQALTGHAVGDAVSIPDETGTLTCTITAVAPLPKEIKAWVRNEI